MLPQSAEAEAGLKGRQSRDATANRTYRRSRKRPRMQRAWRRRSKERTLSFAPRLAEGGGDFRHAFGDTRLAARVACRHVDDVLETVRRILKRSVQVRRG